MADRKDYYFRQKVTEAELDAGLNALEQADRDLATDLGFVGIATGLDASQASPTPNLTIDVTTGVAYDQSGQRIHVPSLQNVDVSIDVSSVSTDVAGGGNEKIVSVFLEFQRSLTDPRIDGNSNTVFFDRAESFQFNVRQGAEGAAPATPPALQPAEILIADITRTFGQTQIVNANISSARTEAQFKSSGTPYSIDEKTAKAAIVALLGLLNDHSDGTSGNHGADDVDYAGSGNWHDMTSIPSGTVEDGIDAVVTHLSSTLTKGGADKLGSGAVAGSPNALSAGSVYDQIEALLAAINVAQTAADNLTAGLFTFVETVDVSGLASSTNGPPAYSQGDWLCPGGSDVVLLSEDDGATWVDFSTGMASALTIHAVAFSREDGSYVALNNASNTYYHRSGGGNWTTAGLPNSGTGGVAIHDPFNGLFIVGGVKAGPQSYLATAAEASPGSFTERTVGAGLSVKSLATNGGGVTIAGHEAHTRVSRTTDGVTWVESTTVLPSGTWRVTYDPFVDKFLAFNETTDQIFTSSDDGDNWTETGAAPNSTCRWVASHAGHWVIFGQSGARNSLFYALDSAHAAVDWKEIPLSATSGVTNMNVGFAPGEKLLIGMAGPLLRSTMRSGPIQNP